MPKENGHLDARPESRPERLLRQSWPKFLDLLDTEPERGFAEFYDFTRRLLAVHPPRVYWQTPERHRADLVHDIILHCCRDDFRVLRRYQDRGMAFAAWLMLVARNKILDFLRAKDSSAGISLAEEDDENPGVHLRDPEPPVDERVDRQKIISLVRTALEDMNDKCRVLIEGAAEGYKPRELTRLLGWPIEWNKKASDDLRECRKKLRSYLYQQGLDLEELAAHFGGA
jgi:RNA polymerase sigma factor (sigma-70 family)